MFRVGPPNGSRPMLPTVHSPKVNLCSGLGWYAALALDALGARVADDLAVAFAAAFAVVFAAAFAAVAGFALVDRVVMVDFT